MFKDILKYLRKSYNLTQKELAQKINVAQSSIAMLENGRNDANASTLTALSDFFGVSIDYLLGREDDLGNPIYQKKEHSAPQINFTPIKTDIELIYESLNPRQQERLLSYAQGLLEANDTSLEELKKRQNRL